MCPASWSCVCACRWEALLIVLDNRPFYELHRIIREFKDERIWAQAEWVSHLIPARARPLHWRWSAGCGWGPFRGHVSCTFTRTHSGAPPSPPSPPPPSHTHTASPTHNPHLPPCHRLVQINYKYTPKDSSGWSPHYHNKLYNLTDEAIRGGPPPPTHLGLVGFNNNNNNRRLVTLAEHTSDHGRQTNSSTEEKGEQV